MTGAGDRAANAPGTERGQPTDGVRDPGAVRDQPADRVARDPGAAQGEPADGAQRQATHGARCTPAGGKRGRPADPARCRPAGICSGAGHVVVHGNPAFVAAYGQHAVGLPAREAMLDMPADGFAVLDATFRGGRPLARWILRDGGEWRLTVSPRLDPESGLVYGVRFHLRARSDLPITIETGRIGRSP